MNREQKRKLVRLAQKKNGLSHEQAKLYAEVMYNADSIRQRGVTNFSPAKQFEEGEKVRMNVPFIVSRDNYAKMSAPYKQFVSENADKEFTVHFEKDNLISFVEEPKWLFWSGDLLHLNEVDDGSNQES